MKDFNIAKYLKEHNLGSFGILNQYVDLQPLKEDDDLGQQEAMPEPYEGPEDPIDGLGGELDRDMDVSMNEQDEVEENAWMYDVDGTDAYKVGNWTCEYDHPGILVWSYKNVPYNKLAVYATPNYDGDDTTPIQIDVNGENDDMMALNQGIFANFNEYARAMKPYLDRIEDLESNWGSLAELEKPEYIYADDQEDVDDTRMMDLGGDQIEQGIISLLDDGFDAKDIVNLVKYILTSHLQAKAQGKKFEESKLNEYEVIYVVRDGKCYRKDDEGNMDQVSMSKCR